MEKPERALFDELSFYTLAHPSPDFIHQNAVDAWTAQQADSSTKRIGVAFALIGLYLYLEKGCSGKQVQKIHVRLAGKRKDWPAFELPVDRGALRVADVMAEPPGERRDAAIRKWCESVWGAYASAHGQVVDLVHSELG